MGFINLNPPTFPPLIAGIKGTGELLISVPEPKAHTLLEKLHQGEVKDASIIGEVVEKPKGRLLLDKS